MASFTFMLAFSRPFGSSGFNTGARQIAWDPVLKMPILPNLDATWQHWF
jgi:hypothetical protein